MESSLQQFLVLYTWFPLTALLGFLLLIARFYQRFSGKRTHYWLYALVAILFGAAAVRAASTGLADPLADLFYFLAGALLGVLLAVLYTRMLHNKDKSI